MMKNKKINLALTLLIICLVGSLSTVSACSIFNGYSILSSDVTVKQGQPAAIKVTLYKETPFCLKIVPNAELNFYLLRLADLIEKKTAKTNQNSDAVCTFDTDNLAPGNYDILISYKPCKTCKLITKSIKLTITP